MKQLIKKRKVSYLKTKNNLYISLHFVLHDTFKKSKHNAYAKLELPCIQNIN